MRKMVLGTIVGVAFALPGAALAQAQATRTADDYVCQLSGECDAEGDAAELETKAAPATKGFSLTRRPAAEGTPSKRAPQTRGFSLTRPQADQAKASTKPAPAKATGSSLSRKAPAAVATARAERPKAAALKPARSKAAAATGRGDLNLGFELGSAVLTAEAQANAKEFAKALMSPALAGKKVLIEGHTDRQGSRELNLELSQRRAQAVADFLKAQGVPADRLQVKGFGFDRPLPGRSAASSDNRRVEAVLVS